MQLRVRYKNPKMQNLSMCNQNDLTRLHVDSQRNFVFYMQQKPAQKDTENTQKHFLPYQFFFCLYFEDKLVCLRETQGM